MSFENVMYNVGLFDPSDHPFTHLSRLPSISPSLYLHIPADVSGMVFTERQQRVTFWAVGFGDLLLFSFPYALVESV